MIWMVYAKRLVKEGKVEEIQDSSGTHYLVEGQRVKIQVKKGRTLLICDCINDTKFCNESPFCIHKLAAIVFMSQRKLLEQIDAMIENYKTWKALKMEPKFNLFIDDLENLRKWV